MIKINQTEEQKKEFNSALQLGYLRDLAIANGSKAELREPLTAKEMQKRKKKRQMVKMSRKANRK